MYSCHLQLLKLKNYFLTIIKSLSLSPTIFQERGNERSKTSLIPPTFYVVTHVKHNKYDKKIFLSSLLEISRWSQSKSSKKERENKKNHSTLKRKILTSCKDKSEWHKTGNIFFCFCFYCQKFQAFKCKSIIE